jgi:hypothetical protein
MPVPNIRTLRNNLKNLNSKASPLKGSVVNIKLLA